MVGCDGADHTTVNEETPVLAMHSVHVAYGQELRAAGRLARYQMDEKQQSLSRSMISTATS